jgi:hypothetical protein
MRAPEVPIWIVEEFPIDLAVILCLQQVDLAKKN